MIELDEIKFFVRAFYDRKARKTLFGLRPVVVCVIERKNIKNGSSELLVVQPASDDSIWMLPQEGVKFNENLEDAATRCLDEELSITVKEFQFRKSIYTGDRVFEFDRKGSRDLPYSLFEMKGKAYFFALIYVAEEVDIVLNTSEVSKWVWVDTRKLMDVLDTLPADKLALTKNALTEFGIL